MISPQKMIEELPVGKVEALDDEVQVDLEVVPVGALAELPPQDGLPDAPGEHDDHGPDDVDGGEDGEQHEPDPQEDVDLLVDDVDGEDALRVVALDRAGGTVLAESALGDAREHPRHGVDPGSGLEKDRLINVSKE